MRGNKSARFTMKGTFFFTFQSYRETPGGSEEMPEITINTATVVKVLDLAD